MEKLAQLTVMQAAEALTVHPNTIRDWAAKGILRSLRAPGTRAHRFDRLEVEQLRLARSASPEPLEQRRIIGPELADAARLEIWAGQYEVRSTFPRLVRRLLAAVDSVHGLAGRAGAGVDVGGFDLEATLERPTPWLPAGDLILELGVGGSPSKKAKAEYAGRTADPRGRVLAETAFVFVTPRRWPGGRTWAQEQEQSGPWRHVRVLDGDALEGWLEATPAVHIWVSEQMGLEPDGVLTAERWWQRFANKTRPAISTDFVLAGRSAERARLLKHLAADPMPLTVHALGARNEAVAFICAAIGADGPDAAPPQPALIVSSPRAWSRLVHDSAAAVLIPDFDDPDLDAAIAAGKRVVLAAGADEVEDDRALSLPPLDRRDATAALERMGLMWEEADRLAALARRSLPAMLRRRSISPDLKRPSWGRKPDSDIFAPLVLLGQWDGAQPDRALVERLVGRDYSDIERTLAAAANASDPPFVASGSAWQVSSRAEALDVLRPLLVGEDLQRWARLVPEVLLSVDPLDDLDQGERMVALVKGGAPTQPSGALRRGLADGLALLGTSESERVVGSATLAGWAQGVSRALLSRALEDGTGGVWRLLARELPSIAEAAPEVFLETVLEDLSSAAPVVRGMFGDGDDQSSLSVSSPHTGLLWALETLCWSPDHLADAASALAGLAAIDPGGRLANRPLRSLAEVLVPWVRHTAAPLAVRIDALDRVLVAQPNVGWDLLEPLWPSLHSSASPPASPRYRDWRPSEQRVPPAEWLAFIDHIVDATLALAGQDAERWTRVITRLGPLPPATRQRALSALEYACDVLASDSHARLVLWETLEQTVEDHRDHPSADWVMPPTDIEQLVDLAARIEPVGSSERHARLFDWRPRIAELAGLDRAAANAMLARVRLDAVQDTLAAGGTDALARLSARVRLPRQLGWTVAEASGDEHRDVLLKWLRRDDYLRELAGGWAARRASADGGREWLVAVLAATADGQIRTQLALSAPREAWLWDELEASYPAILTDYWQSVDPHGFEHQDAARAADELVRHGRPGDAVIALVMNLELAEGDAGASIDVAQVVRVLDAVLADSGAAPMSSSLGHEIGVMLDHGMALGAADEVIARFEYAYLPLLDHHRPARVLNRLLARQPELFVELIGRVYRPRNAPSSTPTPEAQAAAAQAWRVLEQWRTTPGAREDGHVDADELTAWVRSARLLLEERQLEDIGDVQIGQVLSGAPQGADGAWPAEAVRELIEATGSRRLERGIEVGRFNGRGPTWRAMYAGGTSERALAKQYRQWSVVTARWPRTARLLARLANTYEEDAREEDLRARADEDTD